MALSSCSQGEDPADDNAVKFSAVLGSEQRSRSYDEVKEENLREFNVTSFYSGMSPNPDGILKPYFEDVLFEKTGGIFASQSMSAVWISQNEPLKFLAYYPTNLSFFNQTKSFDNIVYKIVTFNVDPEISKHIDFVAAYQEASKCETVQLNFTHQLSRVELQAKSENKKYNFDIAGVRIGSQVSTATFNYLTNAANPGSWSDKVTNKSGVSHTYLDPEKIVTLNNDHEPKPIMIDGGPAMVVPIEESAWNPEKEWGSADGGKMYFSILLRATRKDGSVFYPYQKGEHMGLRVYSVVDSEGKTLTDTSGQPMVFGWAAVPVEINWVAGKSYVYTLNFTDGIGRHDPEDPEPGHPIEDGNFGVSLSVKNWNEPPKGSYNPDVPVPYE